MTTQSIATGFPREARPAVLSATRPLRTRLALAAALVLPLLAATPRPSGAQQVNRTVALTFASANVNEDGYIHANLMVDYAVNVCSGHVWLSYGVRPGSVEGSTTYWYKGHNYGVPAGTQPPGAPFLSTHIQVRYNAEEVYSAEKRDPSVTTNLGCNGPQTIGLGPISKFNPNARTQPEIEDVLHRFDLDVSITREPLRSPSVERAFASEIAAAARQARRDSLDRVAKARQDSVQAARAASAAASPRGSNGATTAGAASVRQSGTASANGTGSTGQRDVARQPRQPDAQQQARDAAAERQRQAAAVQQMLAERQAADEARNQAIDQAASQLGSMVSGILAERQREEERREARAAANAARKEQYRLRARAEYLASPERPRCTDADERQSLTLDQPTFGLLMLTNCRLADSTSAVLYEFVLDQPRAVTVTLETPDFFYGVVQLEGSGTVLGKGSQYTPIEAKLPAGRYRVVVKSEMLGETGNFNVMAHRSVLSKIPGLSYAFVAGYTATPFPNEGAQQEGGLRLGLGFGQYLMLLVQGGTGSNDAGVDQTQIEYGARGYFGHQYSEWRPFVQAVTGTYKFDLWKSIGIDHYQGTQTSFGGGMEFFLARRLGAELGLYQSVGSISLPGSSSELSLSRTHIQLGFTFHQ